MKKTAAREGEWFAVPLQAGGYGVGVVARKGRRGVLFGYFFGPKRERLPTLEEVRTLQPGMAVFCTQFVDVGIRRGEWPILGQLDKWDRKSWAMPDFGRIDESTGLAWIIRYPNEDPGVLGEKQACSIEEARRLPPDALAGHGAVEIMLTQRLTDS